MSSIVYGASVTDDMLEGAEFEVLKCGQYYDHRYGQFQVDEEMIAMLADNFNKNVLGVEVAVDKNHEWSDGAVAWVRSVRASGGKLYATFKDYTSEGKKLLQDKIFKYFSVEFAPFDKVDEEGNQITVANVLRGIALTNRPVIKGMKPAFLSESLSNNFIRMDKFKLFADKLKAQGKVSKDEMSTLKGMFAMLSEEEQTEAQPEVDAVEETVEEAPADAPAAPVAPAVEDKQLAEGVTLSEFRALQTSVTQLAEEKKTLEGKLEDKELSEDFQSSMVLSENQKTGFQKDAQESVVGFMKTLSESQREQFKALVGQVRTIDLATLGSTKAGKVAPERGEDAVVALSEKLMKEGKAKDITEAQKMAAAELSK